MNVESLTEHKQNLCPEYLNNDMLKTDKRTGYFMNNLNLVFTIMVKKQITIECKFSHYSYNLKRNEIINNLNNIRIKFGLQRQTLYMALTYLDYTMKTFLTLSKIELFAICSLILASKFIENDYIVPDYVEFQSIYPNTYYSNLEIRNYECLLLELLGFELDFCNTHSFVSFYYYIGVVFYDDEIQFYEKNLENLKSEVIQTKEKITEFSESIYSISNEIIFKIIDEIGLLQYQPYLVAFSIICIAREVLNFKRIVIDKYPFFNLNLNDISDIIKQVKDCISLKQLTNPNLISYFKKNVETFKSEQKETIEINVSPTKNQQRNINKPESIMKVNSSYNQTKAQTLRKKKKSITLIEKIDKDRNDINNNSNPSVNNTNREPVNQTHRADKKIIVIPIKINFFKQNINPNLNLNKSAKKKSNSRKKQKMGTAIPSKTGNSFGSGLKNDFKNSEVSVPDSTKTNKVTNLKQFYASPTQSIHNQDQPGNRKRTINRIFKEKLKEARSLSNKKRDYFNADINYKEKKTIQIDLQEIRKQNIKKKY